MILFVNCRLAPTVTACTVASASAIVFAVCQPVGVSVIHAKTEKTLIRN